MSAISGCWDDCADFRCRDKSSAKTVINAMRCTKLAGLGALSALCVLKSNSSLYGAVSDGACCLRAEVARVRCAMDGGLKDESRMYSVRGCVGEALTVRTTRNLEGDAVKECKADSRSGSIALIDAIREAMSAIAVLVEAWSSTGLVIPKHRPRHNPTPPPSAI
jgi:hypothetical protein